MDKKPLFALAALATAAALATGPTFAAPHLQALVSHRTSSSTGSTTGNRLMASRDRARLPTVSRSDLCLGAASAGCSGVLNAALTRIRRPAAASTPGLEVHRADVEKLLGAHPVVLSDTTTSRAALHTGALPFRDQEPLVRRVEKISKEGIQFIRMPRRQQGEFSVGISRKGTLGFSLKTSSD